MLGGLLGKVTLALLPNDSCQGFHSTLPGYPLILDMLLPNCPGKEHVKGREARKETV